MNGKTNTIGILQKILNNMASADHFGLLSCFIQKHVQVLLALPRSRDTCILFVSGRSKSLIGTTCPRFSLSPLHE